MEVRIAGKPVEVTCYGSCGCPESQLDGNGLDDRAMRAEKAGIPSRYLGREIDLDGWQEAVADGTSLYVHGPNGTAKSTFTANLAAALLDMGRTVLFRNAKALTEEIKRTFGGDTSVLDRCVGVDVLFLDDLGKEQPTEYVLSMLYMVVEQRYSQSRPVVVSSNYTRGELVSRWAAVDPSTAEAIASRLCDGTETLFMGGEDRRLA